MKSLKFLSDYYNKIIDEAVVSGEKALYECVPTPMSFYSADLLGNRTGPTTIEEEGNCGGAYITGIHGKDEFIEWAKQCRKEIICKGTYKGYDITGLTRLMKVPYHGQSHERYKAFAEAATKVFNSYDIKCFVRDYLT